MISRRLYKEFGGELAQLASTRSRVSSTSANYIHTARMKATVANAVLFGAVMAIAYGAPLSRNVRDDGFRCGAVESDSSRQRRAAAGSQNLLWPNAVVPFVLADRLEGQC